MIPVLILAGGKGTRLGSLAAELPKPMVPVRGKPLLEWQFELARSHEAPALTVYAGHKADVIAERYVGDDRYGFPIRVVVETTPLGTAGAVLADFENLPEEFFVLYGDTMINVDLTRMLARHRLAGTDATIYVHPNDHPHDSDLVEVDKDRLVTTVHGYPHPEGVWHRNLVNAALYIFKRNALAPWAGKDRRLDFAKHLIPEMLAAGCRIAAYRGYDYIKDMGTPERLARVEKDVESGVLDRKRSSNPRACVFLDRDGTMIAEKNHLSNPNEVTLLEGVPEAIRRLNRESMPVLVVTNQPVIARGEASRETVETIHARIDALLGKEGAFVDDWFYCPHHPHGGFPGEVTDLKIACECRKPGIGMINRAAESAPVLLEDSWLIGDTSTDILTARRARLRSALVRSGYAGCDGKYSVRADYSFPNLPLAVGFILDDFPKLLRLARALAAEHSDARMVAVVGAAHSGKSTFTSVLTEAYRRRGLKCQSICLDGFIKPVSERGNTFESRHDLASVRQLIRRLASRTDEPFDIEMPIYDRLKHRPFPEVETLRITSDTVVIIEGVSLGKIQDMLEDSHTCFSVTCDEEIRRQRFIQDYEWRGMPKEEILALWEQRLTEESFQPFCKATLVRL